MSIRSTSLVSGEYYHIYNRGNSKQIIFHDEQDYRYCIKLLSIMNSEQHSKSRDTKKSSVDRDTLVSIGAYCLMPNHFHILFRQEKDNGITLFMQKMSTAYVMYYNKKYKRTGGLFEGKFKSKYSGGDTYLKYLFSYIHLNPLKIIEPNWKKSKLQGKLYSFLLEYQYSSFNEYISNNFEIINKTAFPDYFSTKDEFIKEITSWISLEEN